MSLATVLSRAQTGMDAPDITIEVHLANGLPGFTIVGLPEAAVREAKDRVRAAIQNSQFTFPNKRITVNLAPADIPKSGSRFDLAIALGILVASEQLPQTLLHNTEYIGELALSGAVRGVNGILPTALHCANADHKMILPSENEFEASLIHSLTAHKIEHLLDLLGHVSGRPLSTIQRAAQMNFDDEQMDFAEVKGQSHAKRILLIAAAGGHNVLLSGSPGTGKSMLASRLPSILPDLTEAEALATASVYSISNHGFDAKNWGKRPFRYPHHSSSAPALAGGGSHPKPGEISLAHEGVLFLDELPEFSRTVLEILREPLETGKITISRATQQLEFPANFQLVAAMNPCPCGYHGDPDKACTCTPDQISRYRSKISGPLLDRIDIISDIPRVKYQTLHADTPHAETSQGMRERVLSARNAQLNRQKATNANLSPSDIDVHCQLDDTCQTLLNQAAQKLNLSMRSYRRVQKLARTIADLDNAKHISTAHLAEAIQLRRSDGLNM